MPDVAWLQFGLWHSEFSLLVPQKKKLDGQNKKDWNFLAVRNVGRPICLFWQSKKCLKCLKGTLRTFSKRFQNSSRKFQHFTKVREKMREKSRTFPLPSNLIVPGNCHFLEKTVKFDSASFVSQGQTITNGQICQFLMKVQAILL